MKVLVLGGCGFIGSHVVDSLISNNFEIRVLDRVPEKFRRPLPDVEYVYGDYRDQDLIEQSLSGVGAVVHLISTTLPGTANANPRGDVEDNLIGTLGLISTMRRMGVNRLIYMSSGGTVYGRPLSVPIPENHPLNPTNSYGIVKACVENYLQMYSREADFSSVAIRAANPFGPRQGHLGIQGVVATFLNRALRGDPLEIWGDGTVVRDYLYASDVADLCSKVLNSTFVGPVNAGSGIGRSLNEVAAAVREVTGRDLCIVYKDSRSVDVPSSVLDISRAREELGWNPSRDFEADLQKTWSWISSHAQH